MLCTQPRWRIPILPLVLLVLVLAAGCQGLSGRPDALLTPVPPGQILAEFPIATDGGLILVPVQLGGKEYQFFVDTGCGHTVLDSSLADHLGGLLDSTKVSTSAGDTVIELYAPADAHLGGLSLKECGPMMKTDLSGLREVTGLDIRGIIGMSFMRQYVVQFDFDGARLRLCKPDGARHPEWGEEIPLQQIAIGRVLIKVRLGEDLEDLFAVDTGAVYDIEVPPPLFQEIVRKRRLATVARRTISIFGISESLVARYPALSVGSLTWQGPILGESPVAIPVIGLGCLRRYQATFDFPASRLYLSARRQQVPPSEPDMSGLGILRTGQGTIVKYVDKDSPAEAAGIRPEDQIIAVNGRPAASYDLHTLRALLREGDGQRIEMTVRRDGRDLSVAFQLKRRI
jgi:hypothetical protein